MPRPRFRKLPEEKRRRILDAAGLELADHGYSGASLNRILDHAGVSKGAAYYYFDNKDDLISAVFLDLFEKMLEQAELDTQTLTAENFWPSLIRLRIDFLHNSSSEPWVMGAIKAIWTMPQEARTSPELSEAVRVMTDWLERLLKQGRHLGVVRDDLPEGLLFALVLALDEASDRWIAQHWEELGDDGVVALSAKMFDMIQALLAPEEG
jgi:AcrR family transcriptional regulator